MADRFSKEQLNSFKQQLLEMKEAVEREIEQYSVMDKDEDMELLSPHTNHPGDAGTTQYENEFNLGMEQFSKDRMQDIEDALAKIKDGTYGISEVSGKPIPAERLEALPTARNLVEEEENLEAR